MGKTYGNVFPGAQYEENLLYCYIQCYMVIQWYIQCYIY